MDTISEQLGLGISCEYTLHYLHYKVWAEYATGFENVEEALFFALRTGRSIEDMIVTKTEVVTQTVGIPLSMVEKVKEKWEDEKGDWGYE